MKLTNDDRDRDDVSDIEEKADEDSDLEDLDDSRFGSAFAKSKTSSNVNKPLADMMSKASTSTADSDFVKDIREKYNRPSNVPFPLVPTVNSSIYKKMSRFNKDLDHGLQKTQGTLCSCIYAVSLISDKLYDLKKSNPDDEMVSELLTLSEDSAFLLSHASFLMSNSRREHLKHLFQGDYKELCKKSQEVTNELFGSELSKAFPKKSGGMRPIINLKPLNNFVETIHFKMETLQTALNLLQKGDFLISVDLKDAYFSIPVHPHHRKYLRFIWKEQSSEVSRSSRHNLHRRFSMNGKDYSDNGGNRSGISGYGAHSTRSASTSAALEVGLSVKDIMNVADWSNASTFNKFYKKITVSSDVSFGKAILKTSS
uniref:Reverse transcriptase domain-containing protein n=1 Tax=Magallana gigas TaxID=29159 RepID=A0A8W8P3X8_MAGGI